MHKSMAKKITVKMLCPTRLNGDTEIGPFYHRLRIQMRLKLKWLQMCVCIIHIAYIYGLPFVFDP